MFVTKKELYTPEMPEALWQFSDTAYSTGSPWTEEQFAEDLRQENSEYLFLVEAEEWLGYIAYHFVLDEAEINHVVVNKQRQHEGIGQQMLEEFKLHLKQNDITQVFLEVRESNGAAQSLYERTGFRTVAIRKNYYQKPQENAFVMCAKLRK